MTNGAGTYPDPERIYTDLREKWVHEDKMMNRRVTWLLESQTFLLTVFGVVSGLTTVSFALQRFAQFTIPLLAIIILVYLKKGINAAKEAMLSIRATLHKHKKAGRVWSGVSVDISKEVTKQGLEGPMRLATAFLILWGALFILVLFLILCSVLTHNSDGFQVVRL